MRTLFVNSWWALVVRGVMAMVLGVIAFSMPGITFGVLVIVFGAYALLDGIVNIIGAWKAVKAHERWAPFVIEGLVGIAAAVVTILWPAITALALVYIIAAWALITGGFEIAAAIRLRKYITGEWLLILGGIASIIFGGLLVIFPLAGALAIAIWLGVYALVFGAILVGLGIRLRTFSKSLEFGSPLAAPTS